VPAGLTEFLQAHQPHGPVATNATEPAWNGYRLTAACTCGVTFMRWVTQEDADSDLIRWTALN